MGRDFKQPISVSLSRLKMAYRSPNPPSPDLQHYHHGKFENMMRIDIKSQSESLGLASQFFHNISTYNIIWYVLTFYNTL